jgi:hypothetical protein
MPDDILTYEPTERFDSTNVLYGNHFRFVIEALPDLTFFAQSIQLPSVIATAVNRATPFTQVREVGDHLTYSSFDVSYLIDASFKTYTSVLWWLQGYGFPHSYDEVKAFRETRSERIAIPRPVARDLEKTNATLYILQPDTEKIIVEIQFTDLFPTTLGQLDFKTTDSEAPQLLTTATFNCTMFDVVPAV